jgi:protein-S-isoprenylcysteine O-methyltransferase Ste14
MSELTFRAIFVVTYGVFAAIRLRYRLFAPKEKGERRGMGMRGVVLSVLILTYFAVIFLYLVDHSWARPFQVGYPEMVRWMGLGVAIAILPLLVWVHRTLGRQYAARLRVIRDHELVVEGPYRLVRHPMYAILWGFGLSLSLVTGNVLIAFLALVIVLPLYSIAIVEEKMMVERFGGEYRDYMERTGRFFPRLR